MSKLEQLQGAKRLNDLAHLLGYSPSALGYILYKLNDEEKYRCFTIPKKSGGVRKICAPHPHLSLLQNRLRKLLCACVKEIQKENSKYWNSSHGFRNRMNGDHRTIVSNADVHRNRRFVFNVDIENFFDTINFGRVRGLFIKDRSFALEPKIATIIAQIVIYENAVPQGSPCSPIISNLIGNILDVRLIALAMDCRCTYTRYADDLTFSTNLREFPSAIAENFNGQFWVAGKKLMSVVERCGFKLNDKKTRMSLNQSRQTVTGLVVNQKPNVNQQYYRLVRSMCNSLFHKGEYYRMEIDGYETTSNPIPLEGMLSHIYFVKHRKDRSDEQNKNAKFVPPKAFVKLYKRFLFHKNFATLDSPLIVTEGISDVIYLKYAIRSLVDRSQPDENVFVNREFSYVKFLRPSSTVKNVLDLGNGTSGQAKLISSYRAIMSTYHFKPKGFPVIIVCDNDNGAKGVFKNASKEIQNNSNQKVCCDVSDDSQYSFYWICENLYLVKVPSSSDAGESEIENLFSDDILATKLNGKRFDWSNKLNPESSYGKVMFAKQVIQRNWMSIDFSGFSELIRRIQMCIAHYKEQSKTDE